MQGCSLVATATPFASAGGGFTLSGGYSLSDSILKAENCSAAKFPAKVVVAPTCEPTPIPYSKLFHTLNT